MLGSLSLWDADGRKSIKFKFIISVLRMRSVFLSTVSCLSVKHEMSHRSYINLIKRFSSGKLYKFMHIKVKHGLR